MSDLEKTISTACDTRATSYDRRHAIEDLAAREDARAISALQSLLDDKDRYLRRDVVNALAKNTSAATVAPLIDALRDDDDNVRRDAAIALGQSCDLRAMKPLQEMLDDRAFFVRDAVAQAVKKLEVDGKPPDVVEDDSPSDEESPAPDTPDDRDESDEGISPSNPITVAIDSNTDTSIQPVPAASDPPPDLEQQPPDMISEQDRIDLAEAAESQIVAEIVSESVVEMPEPADETGPIDIAEAELVEATVAEERENELTPDLPADFRWNTASRMRAFFGDLSPEMQKMYGELRTQQTRLASLEREHQQILAKFGWEQADKGDDIEALAEKIDEAGAKLVSLRRNSARIKAEQNKLEREANSMGHQLMTMVWSDKQQRIEKRRKNLKSQLQALDQKASEWQSRLDRMQEQHEALQTPIEQLESETEELDLARQTAANAIRRSRKAINRRIVSVLRGLPAGELKVRLDQLIELSPHREYFELCMTELTELLDEASASDHTAAELQDEISSCHEAASDKVDELGKAISAGFHLNSTERQTTVRLQARLRFEEEKGFMSGYSNASGTAEGSGTATASYSIDQIQWQEPSQMTACSRQVADAWSALGQNAARLQMHEVESAARDRCIAECVSYLRWELERDFNEANR